MHYLNRKTGIAIVLFICFFSFFSASAQTITATLSLDKREPRPLWFEYSTLDGGLVTVAGLSRESSRMITLFKYDALFKRQWQVQLYEQSSNRDIEELAVQGDLILVFLSEYVPREHTIHTYLYQYQLDGKPLSKRVEVHTSPNENKHRKIFRFEKSVDKSKLLCFARFEPVEDAKNLPDKYEYLLFDTRRDTVVKGFFLAPYAENNFSLKDVRIGAKGSIFLLGKFFPKGQRRDDDYHFELFKYMPDSNKGLRRIPVDFGEHVVTDLTCKTDPDENLILAGFYSQKNSDHIIGILYARVDNGSTPRVLVATYNKLGEEFLVKYLTPRQIEKGRELQDFYLDDIVLRSDGGVLLLAEQFYITTSGLGPAVGYYNPYGLNNYNYSRRMFHYGDIAVVSVSDSGRIEWEKAIRKDQTAENKDQLSYTKMVGADQLLVFYKTSLKGGGLNVYYTGITWEGELSLPKPFFARYRNTDVFYPSAGEQISNQEAILVYYQTDRKIFSLAKVQL